MDTKDTAETTAASVAPAKPGPAPKPAGEPEPKVHVPSVPWSGLRDDSLDGLGVAFSGLSVGGPEGKEKEKLSALLRVCAQARCSSWTACAPPPPPPRGCSARLPAPLPPRPPHPSTVMTRKDTKMCI